MARKAKAAAQPKEPDEKKPAKAKAKVKAEKSKAASKKAAAPPASELAEARARLDELAQQQEETLARTRELAEKAAARAEETDALKNQLAEAHARLVASTQLEWKLEVAQAKSEDLEADLQQAQARLAAQAGELEAAQARIAELQARLAEGEAQATSADGDRALEAAQARIAELEARPAGADGPGELEAAQAQIAELQGRLAEFEGLQLGLRGRLAELETQLEADPQVTELQARVAELEAQLDPELPAQLDKLKLLKDELLAQRDELRAEKAELEAQLEETRHRSVELEGESARAAQLDEQIRRFERDSQAAEERTRELERRLPQLESDLRAARSRSHELEDQLGTYRSRSSELEDELATLRSRSHELEGEVKTLRSKSQPNALLARVQGRESSRSDEQQAQLTRAEARARELQAQLDATSARCRDLEARIEANPAVEALKEELMQAHGRASVLEGLLTQATTQLEKTIAPELERQLRHALARADELEQRLAESQPANPLAQVVKLGELEIQLAHTRAELDRALEVEAAATARAQELEALLATANVPRVPTVHAQPLDASPDAPMPGLLYEPIFELVSGKLVGVEATPCWDDPEHGLIRVPGDSLPVSTCYQLLIHVCQLAAAWRAEGYTFFTALDTGSSLLHHPELPGILQEAMRLGHLPPDMVMLDIPGLASSEDGRLESILAQLAKNGVGLAVEGLGTGTASFAHLALANLAKLDARLVAALPQQPWAVQAAKAVLGLARGQGVRSCAVGVETEAQFRWLRNAQCELGQGSHLSPPVLPEQIVEFARWGRLYA